MLIQIKHRWSLRVLFEHDVENNTMALTLKAAIAAGSDLSDSNLSGSDLSDSNLRDSNLSGSDLRGSDLSGSDLSDSNLSGSDLSDSNLSGSNLSGSNLSGSDLRGSDLSDSNLSGSNLSGSNLRDSDLSGSNLSGSDLRPIKADFIEIISQAPREVPALIDALRAGRVDGSTYSGECSCLVGTIARARGLGVDSLSFDIPTDSGRPAERFFMAIRKGDTPETNPVSQIAVEWAETWLATQRAAFAAAAE